MQQRPNSVSRRRVLAGMGGAAAAALLLPGMRSLRVAEAAPRDEAPAGGDRTYVARPRPDARHLAWVWQFQVDGDPSRIRDTLAEHGLGIALKTHDATNWMAKYTKTGVSGPAGVQALASFFEQGGVPFHAWCVVHGQDPLKEAQMAADVLGAGARSLFIDLEGHPGFWQGTSASAMRFGTELRRQRPNSWVSTSIDPRPWELPKIPLEEFVSFTDEISPQTYWDLFKSPANVKAYARSGDPAPAAGVTASFVVDSAMRHLRSYGRPIHPIGDGTSRALSSWGEFINHSYGADAETVSVWRFGVTDPGVWRMLKNTPPKSESYLVLNGDNLSTIAQRLKTTVPALVDANGALLHGSVVEGMRLRVPGSAFPTTTVGAAAMASINATRPKITGIDRFLVPSASSKAQAMTKKR